MKKLLILSFLFLISFAVKAQTKDTADCPEPPGDQFMGVYNCIYEKEDAQPGAGVAYTYSD